MRPVPIFWPMLQDREIICGRKQMFFRISLDRRSLVFLPPPPTCNVLVATHAACHALDPNHQDLIKKIVFPNK
jgi:hypothetical protein